MRLKVGEFFNMFTYIRGDDHVQGIKTPDMGVG